MHRVAVLSLGLIGLAGCGDSAGPPALPSQVVLTGVIRDSTGLPIVGALVATSVHVSNPQSLTSAYASDLPLQAEDDGRYRALVTLSSPEADSLRVSVWNTACGGGWGAPHAVYIGDRTAADTLFRLDITLPQKAPRPSARDRSLCAADRHPAYFFTYTTYLTPDSTQYVESPTGTFFGGTWQHHTTGSTNGDTGTFTGVVTGTAVVVVLTYDIAHPPCGPTERLEGRVLPSGQWGALHNVSDPSCPVATLHLAFAPE